MSRRFACQTVPAVLFPDSHQTKYPTKKEGVFAHLQSEDTPAFTILPLRHRQFLRTLPILQRLHPFGSVHEVVMCKRNWRVTNPERIKFIFYLEEPLVVIRSILWPGEIERLVRSEKRSVETLLDVHL